MTVKEKNMKYRCSKCHMLYERESTKQWIKSYCAKTGKDARLVKQENA